MDRQINKIIETLVKNEQDLKNNKIDLQVSFNKIIDDLKTRIKDTNQQILNYKDSTVNLFEKVEFLKNEKNQLNELIGEKDNENQKLTQEIENYEKIIIDNNNKINDIKENKNNCLSKIDDNKTELLTLSEEETQIINNIKKSSNFLDIEKELNASKEKVEALNNRKTEINQSIDDNKNKILNYEKDLATLEGNNESHRDKLAKINNNVHDNQDLIKVKRNDIQDKDNEIKNFLDQTEKNKENVELDNQAITDFKDQIDNYHKLQAQYLNYPDFEQISDMENLLFEGDPSEYQKIMDRLDADYSYFQFKSKPDFSAVIQANQISPFLKFDHDSKNSKNVDLIFKDYDYKKVENNIYEYNDNDGNPLFLVKRRSDNSLWQVLYFSEEKQKNKKTIIKVDVYDDKENLRYIEYPNYSNGKIVGKQEHWLDSDNSVYLICQKYDGVEKYQLLNKDNSIYKVITGIEELYLYWLNNIKNDYSIITKLGNDEKIITMNNIYVYVKSNTLELDDNIINQINDKKMLIFDDLSEAKVYYWNNKNSDIFIV